MSTSEEVTRLADIRDRSIGIYKKAVEAGVEESQRTILWAATLGALEDILWMFEYIEKLHRQADGDNLNMLQNNRVFAGFTKFTEGRFDKLENRISGLEHEIDIIKGE